jgi:hypothetical protein
MNIFPIETAWIQTQGEEVRNSELQELNELQLTLVGGGNVIITIG